MSVINAGTSWMVDVLLPEDYARFFGYQRRYRVKGFALEEQALAHEASVKAAVYDKVQIPEKDSVQKVPKLWDALQSHFDKNFKDGPSDRTRRSHLKRAKAFFPNKPVTEVTPLLLDSVVESMRKYGYKGASINGILTFVSGALRPYERYGLLKSPKFPIQKADKKKLIPLTPKEEEILLEVLRKQSPMAADLVSLYLDTGCRKMELLNLKARDVDLVRPKVVVDGKTGPRTIPLRTERAKEILERHLEGKAEDQYLFTGFHPTTLRYHLNIALKKAGVTRNFTVHDLRHTYCTRLSEEGISPFLIQKLAGHSSISTTERYTHLNEQAVFRGLGL